MKNKFVFALLRDALKLEKFLYQIPVFKNVKNNNIILIARN